MLNDDLQRMFEDAGACIDEGYWELGGEKLGAFLRQLREDQPDVLGDVLLSLKHGEGKGCDHA